MDAATGFDHWRAPLSAGRGEGWRWSLPCSLDTENA
jgi:hypothetical protein